MIQQPGADLPTNTNQRDHTEETLYGVVAIAKALQVRPAQVRELQERHGLPTLRIGRTLCARADEIDRWLKKWSDPEPTP